MRRPIVLAAALAATLSLGFAQPPKEQVQPDEHPRGGHPEQPRPAIDWPVAKAEDVASIDAIIGAFYETSAGPAGQARDWDRYRSLFYPDARFIAARPGMDGSAGAFFLTVNDYVEANRKYFEKGGFYDKEIGRRIESFGTIAHVWSAYESRHKPEAPPYVRGVNSIQLLKDGPRWWIMSVYWDYERPECPIPDDLIGSNE